MGDKLLTSTLLLIGLEGCEPQVSHVDKPELVHRSEMGIITPEELERFRVGFRGKFVEIKEECERQIVEINRVGSDPICLWTDGPYSYRITEQKFNDDVVGITTTIGMCVVGTPCVYFKFLQSIPSQNTSTYVTRGFGEEVPIALNMFEIAHFQDANAFVRETLRNTAVNIPE